MVIAPPFFFGYHHPVLEKGSTLLLLLLLLLCCECHAQGVPPGFSNGVAWRQAVKFHLKRKNEHFCNGLPLPLVIPPIAVALTQSFNLKIFWALGVFQTSVTFFVVVILSYLSPLCLALELRKRITQLNMDSVTTLFVGQPLTLAGSAIYQFSLVFKARK